MSLNHEKAEKDYLKGMKYKELADKYGVSINTIKSWKQRYNWNRKSVHTKEKVCTQKRGAPPGNQNAIGNKGGAAPKGNRNAVKHGLFAKYLPQETLEIVEQIDDMSPLDILWMSIKMKFAQIIRSQNIMLVESKDELIKNLKKKKDGDTFEEREWEFQYAWDRQANFLNSQSRAMAELRNMLKQFTEMSPEDDMRKLEAERMEAAITKTKKETEFIEERTKLLKGVRKDTGLLEALIKVVAEDE